MAIPVYLRGAKAPHSMAEPGALPWPDKALALMVAATSEILEDIVDLAAGIDLGQGGLAL